MKYLDLATAVSLILTIPTILLALWVIIEWRKSAFSTMFNHKRTPIDWLILGVFVSFSGATLDNIYWGIAWAFHHNAHVQAGWWFEHGSLSNIFARQSCGIIAAYCHIRSAKSFNGKNQKMAFLNLVLLATTLLGVGFWWLLSINR